MAGLFAKVSCTYCQEDINGLRVQCCVCKDFDMCLQCLASGAEIGPHRNDHSYKFVDSCAVSIFNGRGNWSGREEVQLLEATEFYGFGNWDSIAKYVETRTPEEVKEEYTSRFLEGNIGKQTWGKVLPQRPFLQEETPEDQGPLSPEATSKLPPLDVTAEEATQLGYMPLRDDFTREYDSEAEQLVSSLTLDLTEDTETNVGLKLAQVDMYTRRLRERFRRKRVVRDYQLISRFFRRDAASGGGGGARKASANSSSATKEQREFRNRMRVFSQFHTAAEHDRLIESIEKERELKVRLDELLRYRALGLSTQDEIMHYEQHEAFKREQQIRRSRTGSSGAGPSAPDCQITNGKSENDSSSTDLKYTTQKEGESENCRDNEGRISPSSLPGSEMLSTNEIQLCTSLNLKPKQYISLKTIIILDHLSTGKTKVPDLQNSTEETTLKDAVTMYLAVSGWLPGPFLKR